MRSIPDRTDLLLTSILLQDAQMRASGLPALARLEAMRPGIASLLGQFDDELLDAQRDAGVALAAALNLTGGR